MSAVEGPFSPRYRRLTIGVLLSITLNGFENLGVATAMPVVSDALHGKTLYGWAFSAFLLGQLLGTVLAGTDADRAGPRRGMAISLSLFAAGLVLGTVANSMAVVVAGRALAGAGSGAALMLNFAIIGTSYDEVIRPRMIAASQGAWVLPALIGPAIAGPIAEHVSWRLVFGGLIPLVLLVIWLLVPVVANSPVTGDAAAVAALAASDAAALASAPDGRRPERFWTATGRDRVIAALVVTAGGGGIVVGLGQHVLWRAVVITLFGLALCAWTAPVLFPQGTVSSRAGLPSIVLAYAMLLGGFVGVETFFPRALDDVRHLSAFVGGLFLSTGTVAWSAGSYLQTKRAYLWLRPSVRSLTVSVFAVGVVIAGTSVVSGAPIVLGLAGWLLAGLGMGTTFNAVTESVYRTTPQERIGAATSATQLGGSLVAAIATGTNGALNNVADRRGWTARSASWLVLVFEIGVIAFTVFAVARVRIPSDAAAIAAGRDRGGPSDSPASA